jgi:DNA polymerase-3 subunit alpha
LDIEAILLDDERPMSFQRGETMAIFQYESVGMQKSIVRKLKPTQFADFDCHERLTVPPH